LMSRVLMGTIWFRTPTGFDWVIIQWWRFVNYCGLLMRWRAILSSLLVELG
jgi:hypothetical protein